MSFWKTIGFGNRGSFGLGKKPKPNQAKLQLDHLENRVVPTTSMVFTPDAGSPAHVRIFGLPVI